MSCPKKWGACWLFALLLLAPSGLAQDESEAGWLSEFLGFNEHLKLTPQTVGKTTGDDSTVGLGYKYSRRFKSFASGRDFDLTFESSGLFAADEVRSSDRQFSHKLKLNLVGIRFGDYLQGSRRFDYKRFEEVDSGLNYQLAGDTSLIYSDPQLKEVRNLYRDWITAVDTEDGARILAEAQELYAQATGMELTEGADQTWPVIDAIENDWLEKWVDESSRLSWLSLELNAGVEHGQSTDDLQLVGGLKLYGKFETVGESMDELFKLIRGYDEVSPVNDRNGPYLWAGYDLVDASENETRRGITGGSDESFGRFSAGAFYRNELFNMGSESDPELVSAEFKWEYFSEQDAPSSIRAAGRDSTSYLSASLVFDGGVFLEYKDGSRPLDVDDSEAISLGWRYTPGLKLRR